MANFNKWSERMDEFRTNNDIRLFVLQLPKNATSPLNSTKNSG